MIHRKILDMLHKENLNIILKNENKRKNKEERKN